MYNVKYISRMLHLTADGLTSGKCGLDDEELVHIAEDFDTTDCGMDTEQLRKVAQAYDDLPQSKKEELAEKCLNRKLYEEALCIRYGIERPTLFRWIAKGKLPKFRRDGNGRQFMYALEADASVRAYENAREEKKR